MDGEPTNEKSIIDDAENLSLSALSEERARYLGMCGVIDPEYIKTIDRFEQIVGIQKVLHAITTFDPEKQSQNDLLDLPQLDTKSNEEESVAETCEQKANLKNENMIAHQLFFILSGNDELARQLAEEFPHIHQMALGILSSITLQQQQKLYGPQQEKLGIDGNNIHPLYQYLCEKNGYNWAVACYTAEKAETFPTKLTQEPCPQTDLICHFLSSNSLLLTTFSDTYLFHKLFSHIKDEDQIPAIASPFNKLDLLHHLLFSGQSQNFTPNFIPKNSPVFDLAKSAYSLSFSEILQLYSTEYAKGNAFIQTAVKSNLRAFLNAPFEDRKSYTVRQQAERLEINIKHMHPGYVINSVLDKLLETKKGKATALSPDTYKPTDMLKLRIFIEQPPLRNTHPYANIVDNLLTMDSKKHNNPPTVSIYYNGEFSTYPLIYSKGKTTRIDDMSIGRYIMETVIPNQGFGFATVHIEVKKDGQNAFPFEIQIAPVEAMPFLAMQRAEFVDNRNMK